jgi:arylsulfatase A-like enzyme
MTGKNHPQNVIFIMNDTFRRDHLSCYGNDWIQTPNLAKFAQHAAIFDQYYIGSYPTVPHRWDVFTGQFGFPSRGWQPLEPEDVTLAQLLSARNYHTQMIWDTPMLGLGDYNYTRGFAGTEFVRGQQGDRWITDPTLSLRMPAQPHKIRSVAPLKTYLSNHAHRRYEREYCCARTMSAAVEWLECNYQHDGFFLWIDMWDPHEPFDCPWYDYGLYADPNYDGDQMLYPQYGRPNYMTEADRINVKARYAGQATLADRWVGYFLDMAERLGLFKNTLIIWASDHGHLFGEHDLQGKPGAELGKLYEITTRIPLLVHHPDGLGAGQHVSGIVQPPDILPSILDFLDLDAPANSHGQSFWPLITGEKETLHEYAFSSRYSVATAAGEAVPDRLAMGKQPDASFFDGWAGSDRVVEPSTITNHEWAYVHAPQGRPSELYHLATDPHQTTNALEQHPEVAKAMHEAWVDFLAAHDAPPTRLQPFRDGQADIHLAADRVLYAFRDDQGLWLACPVEEQALALAYRDDAPGSKRKVETITFGALLDDNPKNLLRLVNQYYWAEDLA